VADVVVCVVGDDHCCAADALELGTVEAVDAIRLDAEVG
jgi:hypothetical protein